ncbi:ornithine carbamoyltransferase [Acidipropionibacterium jensenii]|uniref:Ornithine carbamoyltransferase n=2 Tax=Acidipropionibacterium jensenii TaxID=1749 RepID=A0A3Q9UKH7_9ACTN|nr:ornithine carbamoyltransferase [Acidipropionibacterium jensenii]AZZ39267.1 ornithine carbamoyltransferase [Acidipropionibacterium jensenii]AZZ42321.1 ornithine carbamoyltransferase [Acidipropionibacterium jensenii]
MRHFLRDDDITSAEQRAVLSRGLALKADRFSSKPFAGPHTVAVIFDKSSTRTRVSFAVGIADLGGSPLVIDAASSQMGRGEPIADTAKVLSSMCSMIVWRTFAQDRLDEMAANSKVPVVNALTDQFHPCQILADLMTIAETRGGLSQSGPALAGRSLGYLGDGANNMAASYLIGGALAGMDVRVGCPESHSPRPEIVARATEIAQECGGSVLVTTDPRKAVEGVDAVITDTWASMGFEEAGHAAEGVLKPYQVTSELMAEGNDAVFMHCLPAYRDHEVTAEVIDGPASIVWREAENRLHAQKGLMDWLMDPEQLTAGE